MVVRLAMCFVLLVAIGSCAGTADSTSTTIESDPGRLVVLDGEGNIVVLAPDGSERVELTSDAGVDAVYSQPIWSPDGASVAWGQASEAGFALGYTEVGGEGSVVQMTNLPFYAYWSPDGAWIGALHNGDNGLDFEVVDVAAASSVVAGTGSPLLLLVEPRLQRGDHPCGIRRSRAVECDRGRHAGRFDRPGIPLTTVD